MSIREQMLEAQQHIQKKQYAEAREILMGIDHPRAREWLEKLDEIAGPARPQSSAQQRQRYIPEDWTPSHPPFDPLGVISVLTAIIGFGLVAIGRRRIAGAILDDNLGVLLPDFIFLVVAGSYLILVFSGIPLATNWRRLGRPRWSTYTLLLTIPLIIGYPAIGLLHNSYLDRVEAAPTLITMIIIAILAGFSLAFPLATTYLQFGAFRKWNSQNFRPVLHHQYNWDNALTGVFVAIALCVISVFLINADSPPIKTFETSEATFNYPWYWRGDSCESEAGIECLIEMSRAHAGRTYFLSFVKYPRGSWVTSADVEEERRQTFFTNNPAATVEEVVDFTLDGLPARYRDTLEEYDGCSRRVRRIYVVSGDQVFHFVSSACTNDWASQRMLMMAIVNTLDLH